MRRALGAFLLVTFLLAGCGDEGADSDGPGTPEPPSSEAAAGWRLIEIVNASAADGQVSTTPVPVGEQAAVAEFSAQFTSPDLEQQILRVVRANEPAPGFELVAAVVAIGCDAPTEVTYAGGKVRAVKAKGPTTECFAAVTSVAILEVPA